MQEEVWKEYLSIDYCNTTVLHCNGCVTSTALTSKMFCCGYYVQIHLFPQYLHRQKSLLWSLPADTRLKKKNNKGGRELISLDPFLICVDKQGSKHCCHHQPTAPSYHQDREYRKLMGCWLDFMVFKVLSNLNDSLHSISKSQAKL